MTTPTSSTFDEMDKKIEETVALGGRRF